VHNRRGLLKKVSVHKLAFPIHIAFISAMCRR
jgi:hypothetical protein